MTPKFRTFRVSRNTEKTEKTEGEEVVSEGQVGFLFRDLTNSE